VLDLKKNKIQALPASIGKLEKLTSLSLDDNQLTVVPASFKTLKNLTELSMGKNKISAIEDDAFCTMVNLI